MHYKDEQKLGSASASTPEISVNPVNDCLIKNNSALLLRKKL